jgi:hypothetical protein
MKNLIFVFILFAALCASASAQSDCGQIVERNHSNFTFCLPADWKQLPRDPKRPLDDFRGPGPSQVLGVTSNYGDSDFKKEVDKKVQEALTAKDPNIPRIALSSRTAFRSDSGVEGAKLVFSATISGGEVLIIQYLFKSGIISHAELTWVIPTSASAALVTRIDASMATFRLKTE